MANGRIKREIDKAPSLPPLGKIRIGTKSAKGYPMSLDYFIVDDDNKYSPLFREVYGEKPQSLMIYFPSNNADEVCREEYIYRNDKGDKVAFGDGETFTIYSEKTESWITCTTEQYPDIMEKIHAKYQAKKGWEVQLTLHFCLPLVNKIYGVWTFVSKGAASTIPQIRDCFDAMIEKNGHIDGVICDLNVKYAKSDSPKKSRFPVVSLVPNETAQNMAKIQAAKMLQESKNNFAE